MLFKPKTSSLPTKTNLCSTLSLHPERRDGRSTRSQRFGQNNFVEDFLNGFVRAGRRQIKWQSYRNLQQERIEPDFCRSGARKSNPFPVHGGGDCAHGQSEFSQPPRPGGETRS